MKRVFRQYLVQVPPFSYILKYYPSELSRRLRREEMSKLVLLFVLGVLSVAVTAGHARAQTNVTCNGGLLTRGTYQNVLVPAGHTCQIDPTGTTTVLGNITIQQGATFLADCSNPFVVQCLVVDKNIVATNANSIVLGEGVTVDGSVSLSGSAGVAKITIGSTAVGPTIMGNLSISGANTDFIGIGPSQINGNVVLFNNTAIEIFLLNGNTIAGNLVCSANAPAPTNIRSPNTVGGSKTGQCAGLT